MAKQLSVGSMFMGTAAAPGAAAIEIPADSPFRILVLANFSGQADDATGAIARPMTVDRDNLEDVLAKIGPRLSLDGLQPDGSPVVIEFAELDDFHPDRLYDRIELFETLRTTRDRLQSPATFAAAAETVRGWRKPASTQPPLAPGESPGETAANQTTAAPPSAPAPPVQSGSEWLSNLLESPVDVAPQADRPRQASEFDRLLAKVVEPHRLAQEDPSKAELVELVDALTADLMRAILHHPSFQSLERAWRSVRLLTRRLETGTDLKLSILDCPKSALAHDLNSVEDLRRSAFYRLLAELPPGAAPWTLVIGDYTFAATLADVELLGRIALVAARAGAPFLAAAESTVVGCASFAEAADPDAWQPLDATAAAAWQTLRQFPQANSLGLTAPRFLLRIPYGQETDPIEHFDFEEQPTAEHESFLWGNGAVVVACLLGQSYSEIGWQMAGRLRRDLEDLPVHLIDDDGEQRVMPCAEALLLDRAAERILESGVMALQSFQDRGSVRLARLQSLADPPAALAARWS